ncbi:TIGR02611 family protein [Mycolicibacterium fluoranthenivorans]|uniref:TIGR02611 family protein n=1 Tax=Mycolicibacterium fluoranthenivorans TaxID=258505 RepID=A0A7G8P734_9MYCO|nr:MULTISPECIES: TIGR02611 family protein [Mycobacteriaceae]MCV7250771.1 TIGR02611 family protein [Mycobacterium hackensackense]QNJ90150.1 TIGR02611 family protein [Mycolicibacterium fluoranthenivorans]
MSFSDIKRRWARGRDRLRERPVADFVYRVVVAVVGTVVLAVGIVAIPYPGPGWAIVFLGLAILATEFRAAQVALHWVKLRYEAVMAWFARQHIAVKALSAAFTGLVVVASLWGLGALYWAGGLIGFEPAWLQSPIGIGS